MAGVKRYSVLQVMSIVGITAAALAPTVSAPAAGKRIMPPKVRTSANMRVSSRWHPRTCHESTSYLMFGLQRLQGPDEQQMPGFEKKGALLQHDACLDAIATLDR